ncbi:segregation and condensation protein B [Bacillus coahuilensis p1.1.43]|uniref:Segregation and condensation protein B n=1 Tax=Bacillus coahuilensis p1.1.43 TaxID=1150625 RepID=A0A147K7W3_9BACI|nr:SMC-Scp complex subunit ScpB [Bacillus coahuilensis]KUP06253.1 segregation and condensation protein B [Bacillus coahuilensis p1.1.43]
MSSIINWKGILESLLFAAGDEGLSLKQICNVLEIELFQAEEILHQLQEEYDQEYRGITLVQIAGTFQLATKKEHAEYLKKLVESPSNSSLSQAGLETLAIVAYKQPITRAEIEEIRGVKTERPIQTLVSKGLIREVGRAEGTGRAILYGTTREFLDYFGLKDLKELPPLSESLSDEDEMQDADLFFEKFQETFETTPANKIDE